MNNLPIKYVTDLLTNEYGKHLQLGDINNLISLMRYEKDLINSMKSMSSSDICINKEEYIFMRSKGYFYHPQCVNCGDSKLEKQTFGIIAPYACSHLMDIDCALKTNRSRVGGFDCEICLKDPQRHLRKQLDKLELRSKDRDEWINAVGEFPPTEYKNLMEGERRTTDRQKADRSSSRPKSHRSGKSEKDSYRENWAMEDQVFRKMEIADDDDWYSDAVFDTVYDEVFHPIK